MRELIVGPVLEDIVDVDFTGDETILATAFYTKKPLQNFHVGSARLNLFVRLDTTNPRAWAEGVIDPAALLAFVERHEARNIVVNLRRSRNAHAKAYLGRGAFLVGSANFTGNGLSGRRHEILWRETNRHALNEARARMADYSAGLLPMTTAQLRAYVAANEAQMLAMRRQLPPRTPNEDRPQIGEGRPPRLGGFDDFVDWARVQPGVAGQVIYDRAHGKSQLSGHVRNCFYGGRQLLVSDPSYRRRLLQQNPDTYRVLRDPAAVRRIRAFTMAEVTDEPDFRASVWRNISPIELGGRVDRQGGLIGSLNRTLPLLARYLGDRLA
jgi:hypothetical protein